MLLLLEFSKSHRDGGIVLGDGCGEGSKSLGKSFIVGAGLSHDFVGTSEGAEVTFVALLFVTNGARDEIVQNGCERS